MKLNALASGLPGHPTHPPLTDAVIGLYTGAAAFGVLSALGLAEENTAIAWWLALVAGLIVTVPTAATGLIDWLKLSRATPVWRTATAHLVAMVSASVFFLLAAVFGHAGYVEREVATSGLLLTLAGFALLTLGGWLGGTVVFVHGMRVLNLVDEPSRLAVAPTVERERTPGKKEERGGLTRY